MGMDRRVIGIGFIAYAYLSLLWGGTQVEAAIYFTSLVAAFYLGTAIDVRRIWLGVAIALSINTLIHFAQWHYLIDMPIRSTGLIGNQNYAGCLLALALAGAIVYRFFWFLPIGAYGIYLTQSRGSILAAGAVGLVSLVPKYKVTAFCLVVATGILIFHAKIDLENATSSRLGVWQDTINHLTFFGHGLGSFYDSYASWPVHINMTLERPPHAYNDFLEIIFQFGIGSILLWTMLIWIVSESSGEGGLVVLAWAILALTYFPLYVPISGHLICLTLGVLYGKMAPYGIALPSHRRAGDLGVYGNRS